MHGLLAPNWAYGTAILPLKHSWAADNLQGPHFVGRVAKSSRHALLGGDEDRARKLKGSTNPNADT